MVLKDQPAKLQPFLFHGVDLRWGSESKEAEGACPFCTHPTNFHVKVATGQYRCLSSYCEKSGNIYVFLNDYWAFCRETNTKDADLAALAASRGLSKGSTPKAWGFAKSTLLDEWIVIGQSAAGKIVNLYRWTEIEGKFRLLATPGCSNTLFGVHLWNKDKKEAHILEGIWDGMVYWERLGMLRAVGLRKVLTTDVTKSLRSNINVVAIAGFRGFNEQWSSLFTGFDVAVMLHSDHPKIHPITGAVGEPSGFVGMKQISGILTTSPTIRYLYWGPKGYAEDKKDGYDIRDVCAETKPVDLFAHLPLQLVPESWKDAANQPIQSKKLLTPVMCSTYKEVRNCWMKALRWTESLNEALIVALSVVVSTKQQGDQLWLRFIARPGSAKTRICDALCVSSTYCYPLGVQKGFHSGWKGEDPDEDFSLLAKTNGMTWVTKEGDTLLSSAMLSEILAQGREIYDGNSSSDWRNRKEQKVYSGLRNTWIIAGTKSLRRLNRSNLGDRFIDFVLDKPDEEEEEDILNRAASIAIRSVKASSDGTAESQLDSRLTDAYRITGGYVNWLREIGYKTLDSVEFSASAENQCKRLARFTSLMRARPDKEDDEVDHESELPTRLTSQFIRLAFCAAIVLNKQSVDDEVMKLVFKTAMSTSHGLNLRIIEMLYHASAGYDGTTISLTLRVGEASVRGACRFLHTLGVVRPYKRPNSQGRGNHRGMWELSMATRRLFRDILEYQEQGERV